MSSPHAAASVAYCGDAVAKRPVLGQRLDEIDEDILRAKAGACRRVFLRCGDKALLLREGTRVVDGQLNDDEIVAAPDSASTDFAPDNALDFAS